jgi:hypothetical protein
MTPPFDPKRFRAYEIEFGAGGQRLGCKFLLDDESILFVHDLAAHAPRRIEAALRLGRR